MGSVTAISESAFIYQCLENVTRLIPGSTCVYYLVNDQLSPQQHILCGISSDTHQCYLNGFMAIDPLHPQHYNRLPVSFAGLTDTVRKSVYYRQFMKPNAMGDMNEIFVRRNRRIVAGLSLMRDTPFTLQESLRLRAMLPLIEVATEELLPDENPQHLTPKEQMIVELIREGACNKRIASHLDISLSTVKTHLRNIFSKAHVTSRTELLRNVNASWFASRAN